MKRTTHFMILLTDLVAAFGGERNTLFSVCVQTKLLMSLDKNAKFVSIKNKLYTIKLDYFNVWYFEGR